MMLSPKKKVLMECLPFFYPFRNTPAHNTLEESDMIASSRGECGDNHEINVLFLGCGDLRNPLAAVEGKARAVQDCQKLHLHINDASIPVIARNVLIVKIISCPEFDANKDDDMGYVWDIWYNATFSHSTAERFKKDVRSLIESPLPSNIIIPKSRYLEELKAIWTEWLSKIESSSVDHVLADRAEFMTEGWARQLPLEQELESNLDHVSFSLAVDQATERIRECILNDRGKYRFCSNKAKLDREAKDYFLTGITGRSETTQCSVNPTLLQPITGKWMVHYSLCPFDGYLPISPNVLLEMDHKNETNLHRYCQEELKKLVMVFREQDDKIKFHFYPCDALVLCYDETFHTKFDAIDTSDLANHVGLANLLTAGSRKLLSDTTLLFTESMLCTSDGSSEELYLKKVLCCSLSLIPTIYGLRLMDTVELVPEALPPTRTMSVSVSRLRWKKSLPFVGVQLSLSAALDQSLKYLRAKCFYTSISEGPRVESYSPMTFFYVLNDLIHRGGDAALMTSSIVGLPLVYRKSIETIQAWMEQRPVWRVKVVVPFTSTDQTLYDQMRGQTPILRLVLIPIGDFEGKSAMGNLKNADSTDDTHFVDNIEVELKLMRSGLIERAEISFLLEDRSLLKTHSGTVIDLSSSAPLFMIGLFTDRQLEVDPFQRPFPLNLSPESPGNVNLVAKSCLESDVDYTIRLKVLGKAIAPLPSPSGFDVTFDQRWPWESTHRITLSFDGIKPLTLTLPYPILPGNPCGTIDRKGGIIEIKATKALQSPWPDDCAKPVQFRWNPTDLKIWTEHENLGVHLGEQFNLDYLVNSTRDQTDALSHVREAISTIFVRVYLNENHRFVVKGSNDSDCFIQAHPPIRLSPSGAPVILLSAIDSLKVELLVRSGQLDPKRGEEDFLRIFPNSGSEEIIQLTDEAFRIFSYVLSLNATKVQPSSWQNQNLPLDDPTPWLATFLRPLYREEQLNEQDIITGRKKCFKVNCFKWRKIEELKYCAGCMIASYCSVDCQQADWPAHKPHCEEKSEELSESRPAETTCALF